MEDKDKKLKKLVSQSKDPEKAQKIVDKVIDDQVDKEAEKRINNPDQHSISLDQISDEEFIKLVNEIINDNDDVLKELKDK